MTDTLEIELTKPDTDESFERYAIRAHRELMGMVPDPEERNDLIQQLYSEFRGATDAEQMARDKLPADQFDRKENVCLFCEHQTTDAEGQPRQYGLEELVKIVRNSNHRIADMGAFAAISDGHTGTSSKQPEILGYVGNYRLGMVGRKEPKWAIFADEYRDRAKADKLKAKPRRSVELWTFKNSGKMHFDPIAALGSEAPRLALPVAFRQEGQVGAQVERYSYVSQYAIPTPRDPIAEERAAAGTVEPPEDLDDYQLPSEEADITPAKARKILEDGEVNGQPLTDKQRGMFGAIAGQAEDATPEGDEAEQHAFPGGGPNTFIKKFEQGADAGQPQRYMLSQEDMAQIVGAITELPHFKYLEKMMAEEKSEAAQEEAMEEAAAEDEGEMAYEAGELPMEAAAGEEMAGDMPMADPGVEAAPDATPAPLAADVMPPAPGGEEYMGRKHNYRGRYEADPDLEDIQDLLVPETDEGTPMQAQASKNPDAELVDKYSQLQASHNKVIRQLGQTQKEVAQLRRERADAHRRNQLQDLDRRYPGFVDLDEEFQTCLYSAGSTMNAESFKRHTQLIEKYASRAPAPAMVPQGVAPTGGDVNTERYEAQLSEAAVRICTEAAEKGESMSWDQGLEKARAQISQPAA